MSVDFQTPPWWKYGITASGVAPKDYTRSRSANVDYTMDDLIGRKDLKKYTLTTDDYSTVSGTDGAVLV